MKKLKLMLKLFAVAFALLAFIPQGCTAKKELMPDLSKKVWAWMSGKTTMTEQEWENMFGKASEAGIDAIILECHGGYPEVLGDSTSFRDSAAIKIIEIALPYAQKHNIELHAWIWTTNRTEK
ncbi:MAG: hypothetical protein Q7262_00680, partial [Bacteroidales bacterium]|nr:hypothetical protein [Bacteroidales bacterium]